MRPEFNLVQIESLVRMQDELNQLLNPKWKDARWYWNLAIKDELMELAEHLGFKWWKAGFRTGVVDSNRVQCQLEVIDVMHFDISKLTSAAANYSAQAILERYNQEVPESLKPRAGYELVSLNRLMDNKDVKFMIPILMQMTGLTPAMVLEVYTKKWVLNKFRWANGYGDGTYVKKWPTPEGGWLEDNEVLERLTATMEFDSPEELYSALEKDYEESKGRDFTAAQ